MIDYPDFTIETLGGPRFDSPLQPDIAFEDDERVVVETSLQALQSAWTSNGAIPSFEAAGPRRKLFFDPSRVTAGIVTCGGLCPGLNDVIRALVIGLQRNYGASKVYGFRYGYRGLVKDYGDDPILLDTDIVDDIHQLGGTILGSSRGHQDPVIMVDRLVELGVDMLFAIGGDGTQRGALTLTSEIRRRGLPIAVIGIPKTIDNDIAWVERTFGFETAVAMSRPSIVTAHTESKDSPYGIGLVKLMGRESGFIAVHATLANSEVDFCLIPEVPFSLDGPDGFLAKVEKRIRRRRHAVIVVAEGAGQDLLDTLDGYDASGNRKLGDIGLFLKDVLARHFKATDLDVSIKYIDPSYTIRSLPATADDSVYALMLAHHAVHSAMSGRTAMLVGSWAGRFTHVPMAAAVGRRKHIESNGILWQMVRQSLGQ